MILADRAISGGPADMARAIFASVVSLVSAAAERLPNLVTMTKTVAIAAASTSVFASGWLIVSSLLGFSGPALGDVPRVGPKPSNLERPASFAHPFKRPLAAQ
jgi:hypothetical protein